MKSVLLYPIGKTDAVRFAVSVLHKEGIPIIDHPAPEITHLLLDVPAFSADGSLRCGTDIGIHLERLPQSIIVAGGNLDHPALREYRTVDFLRDETYLSSNAAITAECALQVTAPLLKTTFAETSALVIGWGRIGKCLAKLLKGFGADVTVAARSSKDRAMLSALGYRTVDYSTPPEQYRLIINTVPAPIFSKEIPLCKDCVKIDLASTPGLLGEDVVHARGLPGIYAPESSGRLIANTFLRLCKEGLT